MYVWDIPKEMYETAVCVPDRVYSVHINNIHTRVIYAVYIIYRSTYLFYYLAELTSVNSQQTPPPISPAKQNSIIIKEKQKNSLIVTTLKQIFQFHRMENIQNSRLSKNTFKQTDE